MVAEETLGRRIEHQNGALKIDDDDLVRGRIDYRVEPVEDLAFSLRGASALRDVLGRYDVALQAAVGIE